MSAPNHVNLRMIDTGIEANINSSDVVKYLNNTEFKTRTWQTKSTNTMANLSRKLEN